MKFFNIALLLVIITLSMTCKKENASPTKEFQTDNPKISELDKLIDSTFRDYAAKSQTAGFSIAVINGAQISQYNYGETVLGNKMLPDNNTLYEIGSITKTFTASSLVYWLNQKNININTPIKNYLPSNLASHLSLNGVDLTFRQILNHTSGLPRIPSDLPDNSDPYNGYDSLKIYRYILNNGLIRTPGTMPSSPQDAFYYYSNLAYSLAGLIIERQNKTSLQTFFTNSIFNQYGMTNTTLNTIENITNRAYPTNRTNNSTYWHMTGTAGAGGLKSCLADMIKYVQAQLNAQSSIPIENAFLTCQIPEVQINGQDYFGLGWEFYFTTNNKRITVKDGGTGGFTAFIAFEKTSQKALIALFNNSTDNSSSAPFVDLLNEYFK